MKRRMAQPLIVLPIAAILALTLFVVGLSAQFQPIVPDIGFEIEGNTALDLGGDYDWENAMPPAIRIPDPNSKIETDPTTFKPNSKFDDPSRWSILPGKVGPGQSELINFLVWDIPPGDLGDGRPNDYWLVLGLERIKVPGYFEMDFEYNQVAWDGSSGGLTRTPGDVLVGFELRGKPTSKMAAFKVLLVQYWPGAQPSLCSVTSGPGGEPELVEIGTDLCPPYGDSGWYYRLLADDALSAESGLVQATMNKEPFSPPWPSIDDNGNPCDVIGPYEFAEAAINLTALGIEPGCSSPGSVHAKSRSAPHVHSDLKDLVGPVDVTVECARVDGHKFFDILGDGLDPDDPPLEGWEIRLSDGSATHTDAEGYYAFEDLDYGTYTVSEVCPEGEGWVQTVPVPFEPLMCDGVYTVQLDPGTPEFNDLDFGNQIPIVNPPEVSKDAQTSFTRTYQWTLDKTVDNPGPILLYRGDYADVEYQVVASLDSPAYVDSDWAVEGIITIENPGAAPILVASVTDVISPGDISVPVECEGWIVEPQQTVTCTYGPVPLPDGSARTNTATVKVQGSTQEWTATADISFDQPTEEIDETVDVADSQWGFMGQVGWDETPRTFSYPWRIHATGDTCGLFDVPNTATLVTNDTGTALQDDANVQIFEVCMVTIAYEDLPLDESNDWDYNDLVVRLPIELEVSEFGDLEVASFEATQDDIRTAFTHAVNFQPYAEFFKCSGEYTKSVTDNGIVTIETGDYNPGDNILLIPTTREPADLIELRIVFDVAAPGACRLNLGDPDPINQYHGEWLFFDPWLTVLDPRMDPSDPDRIWEIHVSQDPPEPRILTVPADWQAPTDDWQPIWEVYECVYPPEVVGDPPIFTPYWWDSELCMQ